MWLLLFVVPSSGHKIGSFKEQKILKHLPLEQTRQKEKKIKDRRQKCQKKRTSTNDAEKKKKDRE